MSTTEFHPKAFYRKFDALLLRIGSSASTKDLLFLVLNELVDSFGSDLRIGSGCLYKLQRGSYWMLGDPAGESEQAWPESVSVDHPAISLLVDHKNYIFSDTEEPPWGTNSVAVLIGVENQFLMAFRLDSGWERETLEFSLNTIRSTLNLSAFTSRLSADLQKASEIQRSLLPEVEPVFDGYDIAGRSIAAESVGGDLYDYHLLDEDVLGIAVGDASGHGLPAALVARDVITGLRMGVEKEMKITGVFTKLNSVINKSRLSTRFVSLVYGELEHKGTFIYINAGHPPPLLFKDSGIVELNLGGTILGPIEDIVFTRGFAFLDPGDLLILYTDGIIERLGGEGEMFGKEGLAELVGGMRSEPAHVILDRLFDHLAVFGQGDKWRDDATVVVVKRNIQ